jgi:hypothetical protein
MNMCQTLERVAGQEPIGGKVRRGISVWASVRESSGHGRRRDAPDEQADVYPPPRPSLGTTAVMLCETMPRESIDFPSVLAQY